MKLLQRRTRLSTTGQTKNKKEWEFPTFTNDAFLYPMVVGGMIYVYEIIVWLYYDQYIANLHKYDPMTNISSTYTYNYWPIVIPGFIFIFSLITYLGGTDVLMSLLSRKGIRAALSIPRRKLASGVLELHDWRSSRREARRLRRTGRRMSETASGNTPGSDRP